MANCEEDMPEEVINHKSLSAQKDNEEDDIADVQVGHGREPPTSESGDGCPKSEGQRKLNKQEESPVKPSTREVSPPPPSASVPPRPTETVAVVVRPTVAKRRRTVLSIADKADLIRRMHNGESQRQLAFEYGIGTSTVSDVKKHEAEILRYVEANGDFVAMNRRKLEAGAKADVEEAIFEWVVKEMRAGRELSASEVMSKAREEHHRIRGNEEFRASTGWLERFKRRYNIRSFRPGEEEYWKPAVGRSLSEDHANTTRLQRKEMASSTSRKAQRIGKRTSKNRSYEYSDRSMECSSPSVTIKAEADTQEDYDFTDVRHETMSPDIPNSFHPQVNLEEGHLNLDLPPVEEIPSAGEAASMLSKALVWAAAQPETAPQELFVLKQLQTRAALKCLLKASQ